MLGEVGRFRSLSTHIRYCLLTSFETIATVLFYQSDTLIYMIVVPWEPALDNCLLCERCAMKDCRFVQYVQYVL
ncbi:hypothetical protein AKJ16_DCAP12210 [Drosera capensis]